MFKDFELSRRGGKPTHLFLFGRQSQAWRLATCARDVVIRGNTYKAAPISRSAIKQTAEKPQDTVTITMPYLMDPNARELPVTQPIGDIFYPYIPSDPVNVICMATHLDDPDQEIVTEWIGLAQQPKFTDGQLELTCAPPGQISKALYQGAKWQVSCWKTVYSTGIRGCNLVAGAIPVAGTVTAIAGNAITAAEFTQQQRTFVGGVATWSDASTSPATPRSANITAYDDTTITLDSVAGIVVGTVVTANTIELQTHATLTAVSGLTVTAPEFGGLALSLAGGFLTWLNADGLIERRSIMAHKGNTIELLYGAAGLAMGLQVTAIPGCDRTWSACEARGNTNNYGGALYKPVANPYAGKSMSWG